MKVSDIASVINENSLVKIVDRFGDELAIYDGKNDLSDCADRIVRDVRAVGDGIIEIEVY